MRESLYYEITIDELYVGCQLICAYQTDDNFKIREFGKCYEVKDIMNRIGLPIVHITADDDTTGGWMLSLSQINSSYGHAFIPIDRLSKQEQFIFHLSGKLPSPWELL